MKEYEREHYTLRAYKDESYALEVYDPVLRTSKSYYDSSWEKLYHKAKEEASNGKSCKIFELKYEFEY